MNAPDQMRNLKSSSEVKPMNTLHKKSVLAAFGASIFVLSLIAVNPVHAGGGGTFASPTIKFMMKNGSKLHANTRQEAKKQLATDPTVTSNSSKAGVSEYGLAASEKAIVGRRSASN